MKNFVFTMPAWRYQFLKWVGNDCLPEEQKDIFLAHSGYIRSVRSLRDENFITWNSENAANKPMNEIYKITSRGRAMLQVIELESGERSDE